jgi:hypothetical protein
MVSESRTADENRGCLVADVSLPRTSYIKLSALTLSKSFSRSLLTYTYCVPALQQVLT